MAPDDISGLGCILDIDIFIPDYIFPFRFVEGEKVADEVPSAIDAVIYEVISEGGIKGDDGTPSKFFNLRHFIGLKSLNLVSSNVLFKQLNILAIGIFEFFGIFYHDGFFYAHVVREF